MTTVAVIQPYFVPYAGYFRLFTAADVVVLFDCVQFPRRGWVHRNRFATIGGEPAWWTLPLEKAPQEVRIADLRFPINARERLETQMHRFPQLERARRQRHPLVERVLSVTRDDAATYLCDLVAELGAILGIHRTVVRSSAFGIAPELRGQDRVIAAVKAVGGTHYVNPSGGRELYDHVSFAASGLELAFLSPYTGSYASILTRLLDETPSAIAGEIERETLVSP